MLLPSRRIRIEAVVVDMDEACLPVADAFERQQAASRAQIDLATAVRTIARSGLGIWLLDQAKSRDVLICVDGETQLQAHYRSHLRLIGLNGALGAAERTMYLAHELAHVPQHPKFSNDRHLSPEGLFLLHRLREATAEAVATRILWQIRQNGDDGPWLAKLNSPYGDIARAFESAMVTPMDLPGDEQQAARSAFFRWFEAPWRIRIYDQLMRATLARIVRDSGDPMPASRWLSAEFIDGIDRYAGQGFLLDGDASALMSTFRLGASPDREASVDPEPLVSAGALVRVGSGASQGAAVCAESLEPGAEACGDAGAKAAGRAAAADSP